jgi:hypothetical protein
MESVLLLVVIKTWQSHKKTLFNIINRWVYFYKLQQAQGGLHPR